MPYVNVPNDLSKIKTKIAFNLTRRQLICFGGAAAVGIPVYLFTRHALGGTGAMFLMIALMLPAFFMAMYERDGLPFELGGLSFFVSFHFVSLLIRDSLLSNRLLY